MGLAVITLFLPIKTHYRFDATSKIFPIREWNLKRGQDDSYISEMHNYQTNVLSHVKSYKFERGDISEINQLKPIKGGDFVKAGDTLAYINSFFIENEITKLDNLRAVEEGNLAMKRSGEKQELIDEAEERYRFAKEKESLEEKQYKRYQKLIADSVISFSEFDEIENNYELAKINLEIAQRELFTLKTGAKEEEIAYINQKINSYEREIKTFERLKNKYNIISPISGIVSFNKMQDGIITISDTSKYILKIPVRVNNAQFLDRISSIKFSIPGHDEKIAATFISIDESVSLLSNQQLVMAKALIEGGQFTLYPGMAVECTVYCDELSLFNYLSRSILLRL